MRTANDNFPRSIRLGATLWTIAAFGLSGLVFWLLFFR